MIPLRNRRLLIGIGLFALAAVGLCVWSIGTDQSWIWRLVSLVAVAGVAVVSLTAVVVERREAEQALWQSRQLLQAIIDHSLAAIHVKDADGRYLYVNRRFEKLLHVKRDSLVGIKLDDVVSVERAAALRRHDEQILEEGHSMDFEEKVRHDTSLHTYQTVKFPLFDAAGVPFATCSIATDITDRRRAEENQARMVAILEATPDLVAFTTRGGPVKFVNPAGRKLLGIAEHEVFRLTDFRSEEERERITNTAIPAAIRNGTWTGESVFRSRTGRLIPVSQVIIAHRGPDGTVEFFSTVARDITERKQADAALRANEERYRTLFENNPHPMWVYDTETLKFLAVNDSAMNQYGYSRAEFLRMTIADMGPPEEAIRIEEQLDELRKPTRRSGLWKQRKKDGTILEVEITSHAWLLDGRLVRLAVGHDVTEKRRLEAQLRQAQKMEAVGRLAGGVAHDFNNLLTVINGFGEILCEGMADADPQREHAELIVQSGQRAAALTRQLLAFSRKQVLQPQVVNLNDLLAGVSKMLQRMIGEDIEIVNDLAADLQPIRVDPGQMEQVIMNLAVNARDAMPDGGKLHIATANVELDEAFVRDRPEVVLGPYVRLTVRDTGHGMDETVKAQLFEPFFTTKEVGKGTGLGLATIYGIIKQSGGYIYAESEPEQGATFRIYLPIDPTASPAPLPSVRASAMAQGTEAVLVVEDDDSVRAMVRHTLTARGYTVAEASYGDEALAICKQQTQPIDLLLTDLVMPRMSGRQLAEQLTADHPRLKVLFMSGHVNDVGVLRGADGARMAFLPKPFTPNELACKVRAVLDASHVGL